MTSFYCTGIAQRTNNGTPQTTRLPSAEAERWQGKQLGPSQQIVRGRHGDLTQGRSSRARVRRPGAALALGQFSHRSAVDDAHEAQENLCAPPSNKQCALASMDVATNIESSGLSLETS
jgi:hypothetical protein